MRPRRSFPSAGLIALLFALSASYCLANDALENPAERWSADGIGGTPSFAKHIVPLFNKAGCSARDCHGSFQGQKGFRLSLFGYDLALDHKELTADTKDDDPKGEPRPRIDTENSDASLALRKPLEDGVEHDGGKQLKKGTWQYRMFRNWIAAGAPFDPETAPYLDKLEVQHQGVSLWTFDPQKSTEEKLAELAQKRSDLRVFATFSDGDRLDVTALTNFSSNDESIATVTKSGDVTALRHGETHIVASYGAEVATTPILIPGAPQASHEFPPNNPVDRFVGSKLKILGILPSGLCDDSAFLRRAFIDVIGTLPTAEETRSFLADSNPDKRTRLIERLLNREEYALYWATIWSDWTGNNKGCLNPNYKITWLWHDWFVDKFAKNVSFDQLARGIIVASSLEGRTLDEYLAENQSVASRVNTMAKGAQKHLFDDGTYGKRKTLDLFWMKRGGDPEEMAIRSASTFLGIQINCAQCHKHPFDRWTQADFESFASFFRIMDVRALDGKEKGGRMDYHSVAVYPGVYRNGLEGGKVKANPPKILGGEVVGYDPESKSDPRERLWEWMVDPENPYFARSIVNRLWGHYFGKGIVDPIDDFNKANPPSNPELLDWLAEDFIAHGFDLKHLHRRILESRTYQLSHETNETNRHDTRHFSHARVKRMPAEVLWDALIHVTGSKQSFSSTFVPSGTRMIGMGTTSLGNAEAPEYALRIFGRPKREQTCACERSNETGLTQALFLLNDSDLLEKLADPEGRAVKLAGSFPSAKDNSALAEEVYLTVLNRYPNPAEFEYVTDFLESTDGTRIETIQDVLWSLMNVREFVFVR